MHFRYLIYCSFFFRAPVMSSPSPANTAPQQRGRFQPGQSGNPSGRRQGSRNKATIALEKLMEGGAEAIVQAVVDAAAKGDMTAARLVLDRVVPVRKGRAIYLTLPAIETAAGVSEAQSATLAAMAEGEITPDEAATVAGVLESKRKAIETTELEVRIARLEQGAGSRS
jgi:hypothetical protein